LSTVHSAGRTVFIGGSNLGKIAQAVTEDGHTVVNLTIAGWTPKSGNIEKLAEKLRNVSLKTNDRIIIEPMANCAFLGTNDEGLPIPPEKSDKDGR